MKPTAVNSQRSHVCHVIEDALRDGLNFVLKENAVHSAVESEEISREVTGKKRGHISGSTYSSTTEIKSRNMLAGKTVILF